MTLQEMKDLALCAAKNEVPANFTENDVNGALAEGLKELCSSVNQFMKNRYDLYEIVIEAADEIVPNKVIDAVGIFAEVKQVAQGQKALFTTRLGRSRARKFLTQAGLSGVYESFRLDKGQFEVSAHAEGGAVSIDFERMLDGADIMSDCIEILTQAQVDSVYQNVQRALRDAVGQAGVPANNRAITNQFVSSEMVKIVNTVRAYGNGAVIFAPPEFISEMGADDIVPVGANYQGVYHPQDIDAIHNTGYINIFRGTPIVQIPQSWVDEKNVETWIDPQLAYILPTGGERIVKIVFEGNTQMYDFVNADQSMEIHTYRKLGTAILSYHNWGIYQNTGIAQTYKEMYPNV